MRTGATTEQIETAVIRRLSETSWDEKGKDPYRNIWLREASEHAQYIVPSDHRIIAIVDLKTLRYLAFWGFEDEDAKDGDIIERIDALIAGDTP